MDIQVLSAMTATTIVAIIAYGLVGYVIGAGKWRLGNMADEDVSMVLRAVRFVLWPHGIDRWTMVRSGDRTGYLRAHMYGGLPWLIVRVLYCVLYMLWRALVKILTLALALCYMIVNNLMAVAVRLVFGTAPVEVLAAATAYKQVQAFKYGVLDAITNW